MTFPTPHKVTQQRWSSTGKDSHGNDTPVYEDEDVWVYGWANPAPEERTNQRVIVDVRLYGPASMTVDSRDRFVLPGVGVHEVVGPVQDYTRGPFGWAPGVVVNLLRVEG